MTAVAVTGARRIDQRAIDEARSRHAVSAIVGASVPLRKAGREWTARCPFHQERSPSFFVNDAKGFYHCFGCGRHGDAISFLMQHRGMSFHDAVAELLGKEPMVRGSVTHFEQRLRSSADEYAASEARHFEPDEDQRARMHKARAIWSNAQPIHGTLSEQYLRRQRGFRGIIPATELRHMERLWWSGDQREHPALLAAVRDLGGYVIAVQRIWLSPSTGHKVAPIGTHEPKKAMGSLRRAAVQLARPGRILGLGEGVETSLAAMQLFSLPVWATLGHKRFASHRDDAYVVEVPAEVERVILFADNGKDGRVDPVAIEAAEAMEQRGLVVDIEAPPSRFKDWNDVLLSGGSANVA